eukprot:scaffold2033_cov367-Prasinococcus_capsulatus_cf.AAC.13
MRHLLSDQTDPFSRSHLTADMLEVNTELQKQIEDWLSKKRGKGSYAVPAYTHRGPRLCTSVTAGMSTQPGFVLRVLHGATPRATRGDRYPVKRVKRDPAHGCQTGGPQAASQP